MAISNRDRLGKAMDLLREGLAPYVEREFRSKYPNRAQEKAVELFPDDRSVGGKEFREWDAQALLKVMKEGWNLVFRTTLGVEERNWVQELITVRNNWAHQKPFSGDDTDRALDTMQRLLTSISAWQAEKINQLKQELRRQLYDEQVRGEARKVGTALIDLANNANLKPWREVVVPHPDVASGKYQQAEFAADLWQVHLKEGSDEYRDPVEFFRRTYLTESLKGLLTAGAQRLAGQGGDPVVQLQTNFGGGKTHSMLALYHLFGGTASLADLPGVDAIMANAGIERLPVAKRVVLVGNKISPGNPSVKPDGTQVRTLWGELAWQLGGRAAYDRIARDDEAATSPGDALRELFNEYGPALILIDEWVAYARQLHDQKDLPAGDFETQFTFAQVLTESAKNADRCLLVVSLPASDTATSPHAEVSDVEVGGSRGREALIRLQNVVRRVESSWQPATAEEGFEIVRRRLFQPLADAEAFKQRNVTATAFSQYYRLNAGEFPSDCQLAAYEERIKAAYPIHPELFDRLYGDWSTLVRFQRTRGVLRLMAAVIHSLWERGDRSPVILPASIPLDDPRVSSELTRYLSDNWKPIIELDIDGPRALPLAIDGELVSTLGRLSATRRVARTVFLGSAPMASAAQKGLEDRQVKLGCALPGDTAATYGDALRRLAGRATYLYQDGPRVWYDTKPTVTKLADDRAEQLKRDPDKVWAELEARIREDVRQRGDFHRVHHFPRSSAEVPDEQETRLVVLPPSSPHAKDGDSPAVSMARDILETRGNAPRMYRNTLVFLAADPARLQDLEDALRKVLAWRSITEEQEALNLDPGQMRQASTQLKSVDAMVKGRLPETFCWALVPGQESPSAPLTWEAVRVAGDEALAVKVSKKLRRDELMVPVLASSRLKMRLDDIPLWRGNHVAVRQLCDDFAMYPYLERVLGPEVVVRAVTEGVRSLTWGQDGFALADGHDEGTGCYASLRGGELITVTSDSRALVVKPEVARRQQEADAAAVTVRGPDTSNGEGGSPPVTNRDAPPDGTSTPDRSPVTTAKKATRYYGSVPLDPLRLSRDAGRIAEEIIAHLASQAGAEVQITLEIAARVPSGASEQVVRTVLENGKTLKFSGQGFEAE